MSTSSRIPVLMTARDPNILLDDPFDGQSIDAGRWTVTDTGGNLSVSGGNLVCAGGASWGDPRMFSPTARTRLAGLTFKYEATSSFDGGDSIFGWMNDVTGALATVVHGIGFRGSDVTIRVMEIGSVQVPVMAKVTGSSYQFRITLKASGSLTYVSTDGGITFPLVWENSSDTTASLYGGLSNLDDVFTSSHVRVYQGSAKSPIYSGTPAAPVPSLGAEALTDPGLEGNYTAGLNDSLTKDGAPTVAQSADAHGGTKAQSFTGTGGGDGLRIVPAQVGGTWYQSFVWCKRTAGTRGDAYITFADGTNALFAGGTDVTGINWATYRQVLLIFRSTGGVAKSQIYVQTQDTVFDTVVIDDISFKPITLASTLTLAADPGQKNGITDSHPTLTAGTQCGHAIWVDSATTPTYGLFAYSDGTNVHLDKLVNGTWTSLISAAATYSAGAQLRTVAIGTSVALYYAGSQIGVTQTVSDAGMGTKVCGLSTYASNDAGAMAVNA